MAPFAVRAAEDPEQIAALFTVMEGLLTTVTVAVPVAVHVPALALMVYTVVDAGEAVTFDPVEELNDPAGLHVYVLAPVAVSEAELPGQMVALLTTTDGLLITVTVAVSESVQPLASVPVIVYCVVLAGLAVTLDPVDELNEPAGLHVYVLAPEALRMVDPELHMAAPGTETVGRGFTLTVVVVV